MEGLSKNYIAWKWKKNSVHVIETFRRNKNNRDEQIFLYATIDRNARESRSKNIYI